MMRYVLLAVGIISLNVIFSCNQYNVWEKVDDTNLLSGGFYVNVIAPLNGATVGSSVIIQAEADSNNGIEKVEFYIDGTKIGEDFTISPYTYSWDTVAFSDGQHTVKAIAYDNEGGTVTDDDTVVTVSNGFVGLIKYGPEIFNSGSTEYISTALLPNGNVIIAYRDNADSGKGKFQIRDTGGNIFKSETLFNNSDTHSIDAVTLMNGNVYIAFIDNFDSFLYAVILDQDGNVMLAKSSVLTLPYIKTSVRSVPLNNGNVVVSYRRKPGSREDYFFTIRDQNNNAVKGETQAETYIGFAGSIGGGILNNGRFVLVSTESYFYYHGYYTVFDENGIVVKAMTDIGEWCTYNFALGLSNGGFALLLLKNHTGFLQFCDSSGNKVNNLQFSTDDVKNITATNLNTGDFLIAYNHVDGGSVGKFQVYDTSGTEKVVATLFNAGDPSSISSTTLTIGNVFLAWRDNTEGGKGKFVILR